MLFYATPDLHSLHWKILLLFDNIISFIIILYLVQLYINSFWSNSGLHRTFPFILRYYLLSIILPVPTKKLPPPSPRIQHQTSLSQLYSLPIRLTSRGALLPFYTPASVMVPTYSWTSPLLNGSIYQFIHSFVFDGPVYHSYGTVEWY